MQTFDEVMKDDPGVGDVHVASTGGGRPRASSASLRHRANSASFGRRRRWRLPLSVMKDDAAWRIDVPIAKFDETRNILYGWASVIDEGGAIVTDRQGDQISEEELRSAAHQFMTDSRTGGLMHATDKDGNAIKGGEIVESLVLTSDLQKSLGINTQKTGWLIGYRLGDDPDVRALVKDGTLRSFSIGGQARRVPLAD